jgi:cyclopropane fatty-acyl-phospholipid synthase-like methyltransferase
MKNELYDQYFSIVFSRANAFTTEEYERMAGLYHANYSRFLPEAKNSTILDAGCGAGHFLHFLQKAGYRDCTGIDISPEQIEFCKRFVHARLETTDVVSHLKDHSNIYDAIVANDLVSHLDITRAIAFVHAARESLKENGVFILKTGNMGNPFSIYLMHKDLIHLSGFADESLHALLKCGGFRKIEVRPWEGLHECSLKRSCENILRNIFHRMIRKMFQLQGYTAPDILSPLIVGVARK